MRLTRLLVPLVFGAVACCTASASTNSGAIRNVPLFDPTTINTASKGVDLLNTLSDLTVKLPLSLCGIKSAQAQVAAGGVRYFLDLVVFDTPSRAQHELNLTLWARPWLEGGQRDGQEEEPAYQLLSKAVVRSPHPPSACTVGPAASAPVTTGSKQPAAVDDPAVTAAAAMAVALLNQQEPVLNGSAQGSVSLCSIEGAQSQLVAGTNYYLDLVVVDEAGTAFEVEVVLWARPWLVAASNDPADPAYQLTFVEVVQSDVQNTTCSTSGTSGGGGGGGGRPRLGAFVQWSDAEDARAAVGTALGLLNSDAALNGGQQYTFCKVKAVVGEVTGSAVHFYLYVYLKRADGRLRDWSAELRSPYWMEGGETRDRLSEVTKSQFSIYLEDGFAGCDRDGPLRRSRGVLARSMLRG